MNLVDSSPGFVRAWTSSFKRQASGLSKLEVSNWNFRMIFKVMFKWFSTCFSLDAFFLTFKSFSNRCYWLCVVENFKLKFKSLSFKWVEVTVSNFRIQSSVEFERRSVSFSECSECSSFDAFSWCHSVDAVQWTVLLRLLGLTRSKAPCLLNMAF